MLPVIFFLEIRQGIEKKKQSSWCVKILILEGMLNNEI